MKIVPSVLAENYEDFLLRIRQAESITDFVQIDLMDGIFVENKSFPPEKINGTNTSLSFEVHLMIQDPLRALKDINHPNVKRAIFHFESDVRPTFGPKILSLPPGSAVSGRVWPLNPKRGLTTSGTSRQPWT